MHTLSAALHPGVRLTEVFGWSVLQAAQVSDQVPTSCEYVLFPPEMSVPS